MCQSSDIGKISEALTGAQKAIGHASKSSVNPHFKSKYADLAAVIDAVKGPLNDNGIAFYQSCAVRDGGEVVLCTTLSHTSGQWLKSEYPLRPSKPDPQGFGSALTYARRYCLAAIVGIASEEDDDGNEASKPANKNPVAQRQVFIGEEKEAEIDRLVRETGTDAAKVKSAYGVSNMNLLTPRQADDLIAKLKTKQAAAK